MNFDGDMRCRRAQSRMVGMNMATIGVLLRNAEATWIGTIMRSSERRPPPLRPITWLAKNSRIPELCAA